MVWTIGIILLVMIDQASKIVVREWIPPYESIPVIDNFFYLIYRSNPGAAWSFLAGKSWGIYLLAGISLIASIFIYYLICTVKTTKIRVALTLICAGSIGNFIDRVLFKGVTDFLDFHFGSYVFPTFNVADSLIVCGSIFLMICIITDPKILAEISFSKSPEQRSKH